MSVALAALLALFSPPALQQALDHFEFGEYGKACPLLNQAVQGQTLAEADQRTALKYLGACRHILGDEPGARAAFVALIKADQTADLDPVLFPPELVAFFRGVRSEVAVKRPARGEVPPRKKPEDPDGQANGKAPPPKSRFNAAMPFGAGQFQNRQDAKGAVIASLQAVSLGVGVVGLVLFEAEKDSGSFLGGGSFEDPDKADTLQSLYVGGFVAFFGLWAYGVIDAFRHFDEPAPVTFVPLPNGAALGGRF